MPINDSQVEVTPKERRLVEDRARLRGELRKEYLKQWSNPHTMARLDGGWVFDPSMQRWMSMRAQQWHYFKPNPKTLIYPIFLVSLVIAYGYLFTYRRAGREAKYRAGEVSYRDRDFKFK